MMVHALCVWAQKTHTHTLVNEYTQSKCRLKSTRKIFVEITSQPLGRKLEKGIISLWFFSARHSFFSSTSTFVPSSSSTSLHQPPFGLLTREIKDRVCLIRLGEKPAPGGSEAEPGN